MLAYLTDQPFAACEPEAVDPTLAAAVPDDEGEAAQVAYEAALELDALPDWTPRRRVQDFDPRQFLRR
jgi:hypothetical protein